MLTKKIDNQLLERLLTFPIGAVFCIYYAE